MQNFIETTVNQSKMNKSELGRSSLENLSDIYENGDTEMNAVGDLYTITLTFPEW